MAETNSGRIRTSAEQIFTILNSLNFSLKTLLLKLATKLHS